MRVKSWLPVCKDARIVSPSSGIFPVTLNSYNITSGIYMLILNKFRQKNSLNSLAFFNNKKLIKDYFHDFKILDCKARNLILDYYAMILAQAVV